MTKKKEAEKQPEPEPTELGVSVAQAAMLRRLSQEAEAAQGRFHTALQAVLGGHEVTECEIAGIDLDARVIRVVLPEQAED